MKIFCIFVVLITYIGYESKDITVPNTSALLPPGMCDEPLVAGTFSLYNMKLIPLTKGMFTQVDDKNYDWLMTWKWIAQKTKKSFYAIRAEYVGKYNGKYKYKRVYMHRFIMNTPPELEVDHVNHNGLNCQEHNMRNCTHQQNCQNQTSRGGYSKYLGVSKQKLRHNYQANIRVFNQLFYLGTCPNELQAAKRYNSAARYYFGEFANLNIIP